MLDRDDLVKPPRHGVAPLLQLPWDPVEVGHEARRVVPFDLARFVAGGFV
jgi:hypothetical protein